MIVMNSNYLNYIIVTNTEFFRHLGIKVDNFEESHSILHQSHRTLNSKPGFSNDVIECQPENSEVGNKSYKAEYAFVRKPLEKYCLPPRIRIRVPHTQEKRSHS